jgi:hypothetical protein
MLVNKREVILILRLVLGADGHLEYGEALDAVAGSQGQFVGWRGLVRTIRSWLQRQQRDRATHDPNKVFVADPD